jgi:pyruvate/2-oxoglutarate dehydrogenase complex dihydrolipoamide acyltransferase (E2) component
MTVHPIARERRHTLHFLGEVRAFAPVFLDTEVDMGQVLGHLSQAKERGKRYSVVTYVLAAGAQVLQKHPEANAAIRGRRFPRVARYSSVNGKITFDKTLDGRRIVVSVVLPDLQVSDLDSIQRRVDYFRTGDPAELPELAGLRRLHLLPWPLGSVAFARAVRPLRTRAEVLGTFAVTSLGHRPVDGFHSVGGTTITLGLGQITDRPVARAGTVEIRPIMRLNLAFDHRVIDGAEAADVLADVKSALEAFAVPEMPAVLVEGSGGAGGV